MLSCVGFVMLMKWIFCCIFMLHLLCNLYNGQIRFALYACAYICSNSSFDL